MPAAMRRTAPPALFAFALAAPHARAAITPPGCTVGADCPLVLQTRTTTVDDEDVPDDERGGCAAAAPSPLAALALLLLSAGARARRRGP